MKIFPAVVFAVSLAAVNYSCNEVSPDKKISKKEDSVAVANGGKVFDSNCSSCHNFRSDGIGPQLGGVAASISDAWIRTFIKNPQAAIDSGDTLATALFKRFHAVMPSFASLPDSQLNELLSFLHTKPAHAGTSGIRGLKQITDPVPGGIEMGNITASLLPVVKMPASSKERPLTRINKIQVLNGVPYVLDMRGKIYSLKNNRPEIYLDVAAAEPHFQEKSGLATGLGSFAFHPDFNKNGIFYTTHTDSARVRKADFGINDSIKTALQWVLTEWKTSQPGTLPFQGSHRELLRIDMISVMHGAQEITFNPGAKPGDEDYGLLYIGIGDGGAVEAGYSFLVHHLNKIWGTILRIDPLGKNSANGQYGVPENNPFNNDPSKLGEIYASGFRNPNRISWSSKGVMLVSNIGQANIESVNIVRKGADFGWPQREGPFVLDYEGDMKKIYALPANDSVNHFSYPALQFDHDDGSAISGGFEYTGPGDGQLKGKYVFGDIVSGKVFYADLSKLANGRPTMIRQLKLLYKGRQTTLRDLCGDQRVDLRFATDDHGGLYILTKSDGMIYQLKEP